MALTYSFSNLEAVCSTSSSNCCFLTCIQISQETGKVVWYSHLLRNCPQFVVIHTVKGFQFSSVQSLSHVQLFATPWTAAHQASLSITNSQSLLKLMSIKLVMPSNHLIPFHPLLLPPSIFNQHQGLFQWVNSSHQVAKILEFQLQHQSFQWIFKTDFLEDLLVWSLAVQETLKSFLQHHSSKASILQCSAFSIVQLSHPYIATVKGYGIINKAEVDVFLEFSCFFYDPVDVGNLISGSSAFSKSSLNIWKFTVHILLKSSLKNFQHTLLACEMRAVVQ